MFEPRTGRVDEWNEAYERVEDYLRALRIHSKLAQQRLIAEVLARAERRHAAGEKSAPVELAAEEMVSLVESWFAEALPEVPPDRRSAQGRVAVILADGAQSLPGLFLEPASSREAVREQLRRGALQAGPDLTVSSMVPREIELGTLPEAAGDAWENLERLPLLRFLLLWALFIGVLGFLLLQTRS